MLQQRGVRRFRPTRAGVINLWDYRDEEFCFVDGWLVLRGPNGSGKTKALEVLFPFVLDGRIEPRRLNPFASEDRTMKSNLLYRGQEAAHAYVWMEFANGDGFVTIGIGLRAHRHVDRVTRWHFVVDGRVGVDFSLLDADDRPLNRRDLIVELGPDAVRDTPEEHRHAVDARLFGLGPARYEQLLDLVLTLRKPQLAKDLNPVELSRTLQRGLRPVEEALLVEAARSFDDMEAVARTLEGLVAADAATAGFLTVYATYLRTHVRAAADGLTARRQAVAGYRQALTDTRRDVNAAIADEAAATATLREAEGEPGRLRAHLDSLKSSAAYQSHEQIADLQRHVHDLAEAARRAAGAVGAEQETLSKRQREWERAADGARTATSEVDRLVRELADSAEQGGLHWSPDEAVAADLTTRLTARVTARRDDVRAVRDRASRFDETERERHRATQRSATATAAVADAEQRVRDVEAAVESARRVVRAGVREWADRHVDLLAQLDLADLPRHLSDAVAGVGAPGAVSLRERYAEAIAPPVAQRRDALAALSSHRAELADRQRGLREERDRIAAERDDAPPAPATRPARAAAVSSGRAGAPLWRLVRFRDDLPEADAAGIEAALHAAGLLDAWLHPNPEAAMTAIAGTDLDGYLLPLPSERRPAGGTLVDVLLPEDDQDVSGARINAVLASIAFADVEFAAAADRGPTGGGGPTDGGPAVAVATDGRYAQGVEAGRFVKPRCEYIGATARAARRAARIVECDRSLAVLAADLARVDAERAALRRLLAAVDTADRELPPPRAIQDALREADRAAATLRAKADAAAAAAAALDQAVADQAAAGAELRRVVAERSLPVDRLDLVAEAVGRFETCGVRLELAIRAAVGAADAQVAARDRHDEAADRLAAAETDGRQAAARHRVKEEAYRTLRATVGSAADEVLAQVARTADDIAAAEAAAERASVELRTATERRAGAVTRAELGEQHLATALTETRQEALRLRPYAQPDLLGLIRCPTDLRWPVDTATAGHVGIGAPDVPAPDVPAQGGGVGPAEDLDPRIAALHDAILSATRELTPTETSLKQSATRLSTALTELQAQLPAAGLDHRPEWDTDDGVIVVRVADEQGLTPVAHFAERIAAQRRDQEQLLTDSEQRILEDALLGQLARQIHYRTIEARDLVTAMDAQMRARRMSSGLTVGVGWRLSDDLDPEQREVCKLLEKDPARLGPTQLSTLRRHFATRIKAARATAPERPYRELLGDVLDYRQWRMFAFTLHRPGGLSEALTRSRHSQLSGGEQSVSLHLPLFAAANALFDSARPDAPRLLGLDEAFAGVDETGRGELMALATQFDLDLFMTGYDLWAAHPAVGGAAHYDLSHSPVEHTVSTILLVWDGSANVADLDGTLARALGSPQTRGAPRRSEGGGDVAVTAQHGLPGDPTGGGLDGGAAVLDLAVE